MSGFKGTPGPWRVDPDYPEDVQTKDGTLEVACVCALVLTVGDTPGRDQRLANARLIATAPELLEALQGIMHADLTDGSAFEAAEAAARAAISKATGSAA